MKRELKVLENITVFRSRIIKIKNAIECWFEGSYFSKYFKKCEMKIKKGRGIG
jgi:hypothetical protein